ncbi:MAG: DUF896 domain-containing protein [Clostridiales bacterium]|nr:DUF896 domain-containing protein [Clostridiales bacterium]
MEKDRVAYMLSLAKKKRESTISDAELVLLEDLRREYLSDFREGFKQQLDQVYVQQDDGSYEKLKKKDADGEE